VESGLDSCRNFRSGVLDVDDGRRAISGGRTTGREAGLNNC
jgi:hypothetical protein